MGLVASCSRRTTSQAGDLAFALSTVYSDSSIRNYITFVRKGALLLFVPKRSQQCPYCLHCSFTQPFLKHHQQFHNWAKLGAAVWVKIHDMDIARSLEIIVIISPTRFSDTLLRIGVTLVTFKQYYHEDERSFKSSLYSLPLSLQSRKVLKSLCQ